MDKEKVIEWLKEISLRPCDFTTEDFDATQTEHLADDALDLLREQETTFIKEEDRTNHYHCEKCGYVTGIIARMHKFCPECGRKVMWE